MASVLLASAAPPDDPDRPHPYDQLDRMKLSARNDKFEIHEQTDDPTAADVILFVENCSTIQHYLEVRRHPYYQRYPSKCYLHSRYDHPLPLLPGIYPSIERRWHNRQWTRSGGYLTAYTNDFLEYDRGQTPRDYLFSFVGAVFNHRLRRELVALDATDAFLFDTTPYWPYAELSPSEKDELEERYHDVSQRSLFVACPRGRGPSSIRLFETMRMGRAPVIISDAWVPPEGPDWDSFSVRIPESDVYRTTDILDERASDAVEMGRRARRAWEDWFSRESTFHRSVDACLDIKASQNWPFVVLQSTAFAQLARPLHFRAMARALWKRIPDRIPAPA